LGCESLDRLVALRAEPWIGEGPFQRLGAGIQLGPNVFRIFEYLCLTEDMNKWAVFPLGLEVRDAITGETVADLPVDDRFYKMYHAPYAVIHRADMVNVIYQACKKSNLTRLTPSQKVIGFDETASGVRARTEKRSPGQR
jgi:2-polyprenyl-6-methoxyphenol hydroxylase-like FAD-dependent oxidoreductase